MRGRGKAVWSIILIFTVTLVLPPDRASASPDHPSIFINENGDFTSANGVTGGSGTTSDPYIIEGWDTEQIQIRNTDSYFTIRNVRAGEIDLGSWGAVSNGRVEKSTAWNGDRNDSCSLSIYGMNMVVDGNSVSGGGFGSLCFGGSDIVISDNWVSGHEFGIFTEWNHNVTISDNRVDSLRIDGGNNITLSRNVFGEVLVGYVTNLTLRQNTLGGIALGWELYSWGPTIASLRSFDITPDNLVDGKPLYFFKDCEDLNIDGISVGQLIVANCKNASVRNLEISATYGIQAFFVENLTIAGSRLFNIHVESCGNATLSGNYLNGETFLSCKVSTILENSVYGGLRVSGVCGFEFSKNRVRRSFLTVEGSPCHNSRNSVVADNAFEASEVTLVNISNAIVSNNAFSNNDFVALWVEDSDNVIITGNDITNNGLQGWYPGGGIWLWLSTNILVSDNVVAHNKGFGIVSTATNVTISANTISNNDVGIGLGHVSWTYLATRNHVHHNNFINNAVQAVEIRGTANSWDNGYPAGGNFWSDYAGVDNCSGVNQDVCPDPDGIGDTSYVTAGPPGGSDRYPLMSPFTTVMGTLDVDPDAINSRSSGRYLHAYLEFPDAFDLSNIDQSSVRLNGVLVPSLTRFGDYNRNGIPDIYIRFNLQDVKTLFSAPGRYTLTITGKTVVGDRPFAASDTVLFL